MNLLSQEKSPYLKQHQNNPVHWHAWNNETLKKAKQLDKLMLISIGYSTCHWCHVMERESFEQQDVADVMNAHFINVKVDREERADVDDYYMDAVHLMGQNGGWPLNCIALPDGRPIWAGTYVPKQKWIEVLSQISSLFKDDREKVEEYATKLNNGLKQLNLIEQKTEGFKTDKLKLKDWLGKLQQKFDMELGGMKRAPKFPMPDVYRFILRQYALSGDADLLGHVEFSLLKMASAGLFDQIGGGFARYSVDAEWFAPHFEKMLYDNGQLLSLYAEAYALHPTPRFEEVIDLTLEYLEREQTDEHGAFYCGLDADSEGEEGKYYIFTFNEIENVLQDNAAAFIKYFDIKQNGNWEHGNNILRISAQELAMPNAKGLEGWDVMRKELLSYREKRIKPSLDNKILTSWNALTILGLLDVNKYTANQKAIKMALAALDFLLSKMLDDKNNLKRVYHTGTVAVDAFLEDYALLIQALISAFEQTQHRVYLSKAEAFTEKVLTQFSNSKSPLFFSSSLENNQVNVRKIAYQDNVIPSANAVMAENLFRLGHLMLNTAYIAQSGQMLATVFPSMDRDIEFFSFWGRLYLLQAFPFYEIVVSGPQADAWITEINAWFLPNKVLVKAKENDALLLSQGKYSSTETQAFLCEQGMCHLPHKSLMELEGAIWS